MILNSDCCGKCSHGNKRYTMFPMSNIGMTVGMWRDVIGINDKARITVDTMLEYAAKEYGDLVKNPVMKGGNEGWYLDQHLISIRLSEWASTHGWDSFQKVPRNRVDRIHWKVPLTLEGITD